MFRNYASFYREELLAPLPNPKLKDHALSAVRDCLFNIFPGILYIGGRFSIRNLKEDAPCRGDMGPLKCGNEPSDSVKCGEFLD